MSCNQWGFDNRRKFYFFFLLILALSSSGQGNAQEPDAIFDLERAFEKVRFEVLAEMNTESGDSVLVEELLSPEEKIQNEKLYAQLAKAQTEAQRREIERRLADHDSMLAFYGLNPQRGNQRQIKEAYLRSLQREELGATLTALFHYNRYFKKTIHTVSNGGAVLKVRDVLDPYFSSAEKVNELENIFRSDFEIDKPYSLQRAPIVFAWRKKVWLRALATLSNSIVQLDTEIQKRKLENLPTEDLQWERMSLLQQEPLLSMRVSSPLAERDKRPVYMFLNDIYFAIPKSDLLCAGLIRLGEKSCLINRVLKWNRAQITALQTEILHEENEIRSLSDQAVSQFMSDASFLLSTGRSTFGVGALKKAFDSFPGGFERFFMISQEIKESESLEDPDLRLLFRIRDELALFIVDPALEKVIITLNEAFRAIPNRTLEDYLELRDLRAHVLSSFPIDDKESPLGISQEEMLAHDREIFRSVAMAKQAKERVEWVFDLALFASFLIPNPSMSISVPFASTRLGITGARMAQWGRAGIAAAFSTWSIQRRLRHLNTANERVFAGIGSYESLALAQSRFQGSALHAYLRIFSVLRYADQGTRFAHGTVQALRNSPKAMSDLFKGFQSFLLHPYSNATKILRITWKHRSKPFYYIERAGSTIGGTIREISVSPFRALRQLANVSKVPFRSYQTKRPTMRRSVAAKLAFMDGFRQYRELVISKAILNVITSGAVMYVATTISRQRLDVWKDQGALRNLLITIPIDGSIAFYGLGSFSAFQQTLAIGGTVAVASIIGQVLTNIKLEDSLLRGGAEAAYVVTLSPWKARYFDQVQTDLVQKIRPGSPFARSREILTPGMIYFLSNLIGNLIYEYGTIHLFESNEPIETSPWWPQYQNEEKAGPLRYASTESGMQKNQVAWWLAATGSNATENLYYGFGR